MSSVIVFGPTGNVGSFVARTAHAHGAKVALAMRDPSKPIPGLNATEESSGHYTRVQADLTKPDTLAAAVKSSGATRAFIYLAHGSPDHMLSALEALKAAGITFLVFLSSYTIRSDWQLEEVPQSEIISWLHAQVEINLHKVFGAENFVALRPGFFATNLLRYKEGIVAGATDLIGSRWLADAITPNDMGEVGGVVLASGPRDGQRIIYLYGPENIEQAEALRRIGKVIGKDVEVTEIDVPAGLEQYARMGYPKPLAEYMVNLMSAAQNHPQDQKLMPTKLEEGRRNVEVYTGRKGMGLEEWAEANRALIAA